MRFGRRTIEDAIFQNAFVQTALGALLAIGAPLGFTAGCATASGPEAATVSDPRHDAADVSRARRVADWKRLEAALAGLPCKAIGVTGEGERTSIVIPADCLFQS